MNSCHVSYKAKDNWPGLLLVVRFVVLLVFAFHPQQDPSITLLVILVETEILHIWACVSGGVYTNWYLDVLEGSELNNFSCLNHDLLDQLLRRRWLAVGYTSFSIALQLYKHCKIYITVTAYLYIDT